MGTKIKLCPFLRSSKRIDRVTLRLEIMGPSPKQGDWQPYDFISAIEPTDHIHSAVTGFCKPCLTLHSASNRQMVEAIRPEHHFRNLLVGREPGLNVAGSAAHKRKEQGNECT